MENYDDLIEVQSRKQFVKRFSDPADLYFVCDYGVYKYDHKSNIWKNFAIVAVPDNNRAGLTSECVFVKNQLILIGGSWKGYHGSPMHSVNIWTGEVEELKPLPLAVYGMAVVNVANDIFVCGGQNRANELDCVHR